MANKAEHLEVAAMKVYIADVVVVNSSLDTPAQPSSLPCTLDEKLLH